MKSCIGVESGWCPIGPHGEDAPGPAIHIAGCHYESIEEAFTSGVLGCCGCGAPEFVAEAMQSYLVSVRDGEHWSYPGAGVEWARYLLKYDAARVGLTEHGGSVDGAWLTDAGKLWLELLELVTALPVPAQHFAEFTATGWEIEHPPGCGETCSLDEQLDRMWPDGRPQVQGRYRAWQGDDSKWLCERV